MRLVPLSVLVVLALASAASASPTLTDAGEIGRVELAFTCPSVQMPLGDLNRAANLGLGIDGSLGVRVTPWLQLGVETGGGWYFPPQLSEYWDALSHGAPIEVSRVVRRTGGWVRFLIPQSSKDDPEGTQGFFVMAGAGRYEMKLDMGAGGVSLIDESKSGFGYSLGGGLYVMFPVQQVVQGLGIHLSFKVHHMELDEPNNLYFEKSASEATFAELAMALTCYFGK